MTNNHADDAVQKPLQRSVEKRILESWLKWTWVRLANLKLRSDFELSGAMNVHVNPATLRE